MSAPVRLSCSPLWDLQRDYFERQGPEAWRSNVVPSFVTCNAFLAQAYAGLADAYGPRRIVELGSGSGRFAHFFLQHSALDALYVMTDTSRANVDFWRRHPMLKPFVDAGRLDFAEFNPATDRTFRLECSGEIFEAGGPLLAIANYVFDSIEQDVFELQGGILRECVTRVKGGDLESVRILYESAPCSEPPYPDPAWNEILARYRRELPDGAFLLPTGAFRAVENLRALAQGDLLLLSADKGHACLDQLHGLARPQPLHHGSISLDVNFDALSEHCRLLGGTPLLPPQPHQSLCVAASHFGRHPERAEAAYAAVFSSAGPDDVYALKKALEPRFDELSLPQLAAFLRLARWDPAVLSNMYDRLTELLPQAGPAVQQVFAEGVARAWQLYYPLGEELDLAFQFGNLMAAVGRYAEALAFFEHSRKAYGDNEDVRVNIEMCRQCTNAYAV